MSLITVDSIPYEVKLTNETSLESLFEKTLIEAVPEDRVISDLKLNGLSLSLEDEKEAFAKAAFEFKKIEFFTKSSLELVFEAIESCNQYIDSISKSVKELVELYQSGETPEAEAKFASTIEHVDLFVQLISKICNTLKKQYTTNFDHKLITNLEIHLLSVVKGLLPAKQKNDTVMLNDLLEYELVDNLTQWKIQAIPMLKNLQNL